jgi:hypothetical protein
MLDVTTNQAGTSINHRPYYGVGTGLDIMDEAAELLLDEDIMMDPLFEEDWLHENNLDILFDLFEEEIESKIGSDSNTGSSALFGTSPVTSYLFGTSPSLASALDLIYFDNQQPATGVAAPNSVIAPTNPAAVPATTTPAPKTTSTAATTSNQNTSAAQTIATIINSATPINQASNNKTISSYNIVNGKKVFHCTSVYGVQQVTQANNNLLNSTTNAMRIKRGLKKGQCEGTSLLAKPGLSNSASKTSDNSGSSSNISSSSSNKSASKINNNSRKMNGILSKNISDKTSVKITNFKNSIIIGNATNNVINRNGVDINYSKQSQQQNRERYYLHKCQQHVHYITGRAVIREHAYAVRGH